MTSLWNSTKWFKLLKVQLLLHFSLDPKLGNRKNANRAVGVHVYRESRTPSCKVWSQRSPQGQFYQVKGHPLSGSEKVNRQQRTQQDSLPIGLKASQRPRFSFLGEKGLPHKPAGEKDNGQAEPEPLCLQSWGFRAVRGHAFPQI